MLLSTSKLDVQKQRCLMGCVMRGMENTLSFFIVNLDVWPGKLVLAIASIVILGLLSDGSGDLQSFSNKGFLSRGMY
jgi:hypothetical protein